MALEPAQKKAKMAVEGSAGETSSHTECTPSREKAWHESKDLRKRVAFLLDSLDIVPPDVTFHIGSETEDEVAVVRGHKIFFALASPVFQAMWYGKGRHVDAGEVEIPDVTVDAFGCLKEYAYTDSFKYVNNSNVMDVLFASKKYLMSKLTRYCYEYIQNHLAEDTAVTFWSQARQISDEIAERQSAAEIKRNTTKVVSTSDFLHLTQRDLLELTSWDDLSIREVDLYEAIKNWKGHQEKEGNSSIIFNRAPGGILQHVRFALLTPEQLAMDQAKAETAFLSPEEIQELYLYQFAQKQLTTFSPNSRVPALSSYRLTFKYFVSKTGSSSEVNTDWQLFGSFDVIVWPDLAPKACQVLRQYVEKEYGFFLLHMVFPEQKFNDVAIYCRKKHGPSSAALLKHTPSALMEEAKTLETSSLLWKTPGTICLHSVDGNVPMPALIVLNKNLTKLTGHPPETRFHGQTDMQDTGVAIGRIQGGPIDSIDKLSCLDYFVRSDCGIKKEQNPQSTKRFFGHCIRFECEVTKEATG